MVTTTTTVHDKRVSAPTIWSYGMGDASTMDNSMDLSARFIPMLQYRASDEECKVMISTEQAEHQQDHHQGAFSLSSASSSARSRKNNNNRRGSLEYRPTKNRQQSIDLNDVFPSLRCGDEEPATSKLIPAVWSYAKGNASMEDSMELSARFIPVPQHRASRSSGLTMEDDYEESTTRAITKQEHQHNESEELFSISSSPARPINRRGSLEFRPTSNRRQSMDLNQVFPSLSCEEQPQGVTILEESNTTGTSDHHEDTDVPLVSSPPSTPKRTKRSSYSDSWDDMQLTPSDLLSKLMPDKVEQAQAIISAKKQQENTPRGKLYKMSRSECRSALRKSLIRLDSFDADAGGDSNHTSITSEASWSDSFRHPEQPSLEDKKKWGVDGLLENLQEGGAKKKKKKSRRKSTTKKGEKSKTKDENNKERPRLKKSSSCPTARRLHKEEEPKRKMKKKLKSSDHDSTGKKKKPKRKSASKTRKSTTTYWDLTGS